MIKVFNFSGGATSAYMTIKYWRAGDLVIFTDTGREHAGTYDFIRKFEENEKIQVIKNGLGETDFFGKHFVGSSIPNIHQRECTRTLKIRAAKKILKSMGVLEFDNYLGFRADEPQRVYNRKQEFKKVHDKFPLFYDGTTKEIVKKFWDNKDYKLEIPHILGNCDLCFLKGKNAIIHIMNHEPDLAKKWIEIEKRTGKTFIKGCTYEKLFEISQSLLFKTDLGIIQRAYNCSCNS